MRLPGIEFLRRLRLRYRMARRLDRGFYVFRGSRGQVLVKGFITSRKFSVIARPAPVRQSGIVTRVEFYTSRAEPYLTLKQRPFMVSRKSAFRGRRLQLA